MIVKVIVKNQGIDFTVEDFPIIPGIDDIIAPFEEKNDKYIITSRSIIRKHTYAGDWEILCIANKV